MKANVVKSGRGRPVAKIVFPKSKTFFKRDIEALNPHVAGITVQKHLERMQVKQVGQQYPEIERVSTDYMNGSLGRPMIEFQFRTTRLAAKKAAQKSRLTELSATAPIEVSIAEPEVVAA